MYLFLRKVRLTKLEFQETCQRNKQTVNNRSGDKAKLELHGVVGYICQWKLLSGINVGEKYSA